MSAEPVRLEGDSLVTYTLYLYYIYPIPYTVCLYYSIPDADVVSSLRGIPGLPMHRGTPCAVLCEVIGEPIKRLA